MAKETGLAPTVAQRAAATRHTAGKVGRDDASAAQKAGLQDAPRDTPEWVEEALAWIKKERAKHEDYAKRHLESASAWAQSGYIDIATNELRAAVYESGLEHGFMLAHMRLLEGQQGIR